MAVSRSTRSRTTESSSPVDSSPAVITRITINDLFGKYSYSIPPTSDDTWAPSFRRLLLLYGDNGSGKTTILRLVYHLLSPAANKGHRTFLAQTPFRQLVVEFADGTRISARRTASNLTGTFTVEVSKTGTRTIRVKYEATEELKIPPVEVIEPDESLYLDALTTLKLMPYYLADDRTIDSDDLISARGRLSTYDREREFLVSLATSDERTIWERRREIEIELAIRRAQDWIRQQTFRGTNTGSASANSIYLDVLKRIANAASPLEIDQNTDGTADLGVRLKGLEERTAAYAGFGLTPSFDADRFLRILKRAPADRKQLLIEVLVPYLEGLQARLDALQDVQEVLLTLTSTINSFLTDKSLSFTLRSGFVIETSDGTRLPPTALSSGERQLLLLLCNVLVAREATRLFVIDEPELSLNVKWQRQLLDALLDCTRGTDMQFLVATHSIEMVSGHRDSVARLVST